MSYRISYNDNDYRVGRRRSFVERASGLRTTGAVLGAFTAGLCLSAILGLSTDDPADDGEARGATALLSEGTDLQELKGMLALREVEMERLEAIQEYSAMYGIPADLSAAIHDVSLAEGLRTDLAFRLVKIESSFRRGAVSHAGAVGYTQIKPTTANWMDPSLSYSDLFQREINLRYGFRYLVRLLERYEGDERLALLAYNRGPNRVGSLLAAGTDPSNGYADRILQND